MEITNPAAAHKYLASHPRRSLVVIAAEGVERASSISARQGNPAQAADYAAAARVLRSAAVDPLAPDPNYSCGAAYCDDPACIIHNLRSARDTLTGSTDE